MVLCVPCGETLCHTLTLSLESCTSPLASFILVTALL